MAFKAYRVTHIDTQTGEFKTEPINMKDVVLTTPDEVRNWLIGPPFGGDIKQLPGYFKTHPELAGARIIVSEDTH